ncbi:MAG: response regulator transcription factor [Candidatus Doudnabacteria bacterium]|nr:response regulator transcription factor [Candidatus Doudnabacteria bacterium]
MKIGLFCNYSEIFAVCLRTMIQHHGKDVLRLRSLDKLPNAKFGGVVICSEKPYWEIPAGVIQHKYGCPIILLTDSIVCRVSVVRFGVVAALPTTAGLGDVDIALGCLNSPMQFEHPGVIFRRAKPRVSKRDAEILLLIASGVTNAEIEKQMGLGPRSVSYILSCLRNRFGIDRNGDLRKTASDLGCIEV